MSITDEIRKTMGISLSARFSFTSDSDPGNIASLDYQFGVNDVPTVTNISALLEQMPAAANTVLGCTDARITHLGDFGLARTASLEWPPKEPQ